MNLSNMPTTSFDELQDYAELHFCDMNRAALELGSPLINKPSIWPNVINVDNEQISQVVPQLVIDGEQDLLTLASKSVANAIQFPVNTCFMHGLGCISSAMTKAFSYKYKNNSENAPVNLYCVSAQPPSTGKSGVNSFFTKPITDAYDELNKENSSERRQLQREIKKINKQLDSGKDLNDFQESELFDRLDKAEEALERLPYWSPIVTDPTIEAAEELAGTQGGMFNIISAEAEAISVVVGSVYGDTAGGKKANYGPILKAWDGEYSKTSRISRDGYDGYLRATIAVIAQAESVEGILAAAASDRGLAERFLLMIEPSLLGERDHMKEADIEYALIKKYEGLIRNIVREDSVVLEFTDKSRTMIKKWRQTIEPELKSNGKYSHNLLTGFMGKADKQIMKMACILHGIDNWQDGGKRETKIKDNYTAKAIYLFEEFAKTFISAADKMGYVGSNSEIIALAAQLQKRIDKGVTKISFSQLYNNIKGIKPFKGSRDLSKKLRDELIPHLESHNYCVSDSKTIYINPRLK